MRVAYADPPYIGCARLYKDHPDYAGEVDHAELVSRLASYDAWALSLHSPSLKVILPMCPDDVRVMAWVKPFAVFKPNVRVAYAWEPVIVKEGRKGTRKQPTVPDFVSCPITLRKGLVGVKPERFCFWLFEVLNMRRGDEFHDLFPGSGAVSRAWKAYREQAKLPLAFSPAPGGPPA